MCRRNPKHVHIRTIHCASDKGSPFSTLHQVSLYSCSSFWPVLLKIFNVLHINMCNHVVKHGVMQQEQPQTIAPSSSPPKYNLKV
ncbi:hypothetical protein BD408DRAFT_410487, partial [Parasitella parasitica]